MSYLTIRHLVMSGESALEHKDYWAALAVALMLPSMCGRLEFDDNAEYFTIDKTDGYKKWKDKKVYIDWCKKHIFSAKDMTFIFGDDGPDILYLLRCDMVHAGYADVYYNSRSVYLAINMDGRLSQFSNRLILDVKGLCTSIFIDVKFWCDAARADRTQYTFVFNGHETQDMLLYEDLRNQERLLMAKAQFEKYEQVRKQAVTRHDKSVKKQ